MLYPFVFEPRFKERIWGGRSLERLYGKKLPPSLPIGESWEISDRPGDESVIRNGPLTGKDIRWLMVNHPEELLGSARPASSGRFPLLVKILDAQQTLSLQVHPPADKAAALGGEPKTEMWYIAEAASQAELFVGLKRGVTRDAFERRIQSGTVEQCFHRVAVKKGDAMFLPSGRVHALGAGVVIFEVQQNSDTTYRVFDWNRVDATGTPRELHIPQSLKSIDFEDFEPGLVADSTQPTHWLVKAGANGTITAPFSVSRRKVNSSEDLSRGQGVLQIIGVTKGELQIVGRESVLLRCGEFCLIPASAGAVTLRTASSAEFLLIEPA